jgi:hypothetical protein
LANAFKTMRDFLLISFSLIPGKFCSISDACESRFAPFRLPASF